MISADALTCARAVRIEDEVARRSIKLHGRIDRCGPCPRCGGPDRFSVNTKKQCWNCRKCKLEKHKIPGDVIGLVQWFNGVGFLKNGELDNLLADLEIASSGRVLAQLVRSAGGGARRGAADSNHNGRHTDDAAH